MYSPILRNRQSELLAIKNLSQDVRPLMMPVLDVAAPTISVDKVKHQEFLARNLTRTTQSVAGFPAVFVDSSELDPAVRIGKDVHPLEALANAVSGAGSQPIPVTGLHRDAAHQEAAVRVADSLANGSICIRLDASDVSTATLTFKRLRNLLESMAIESSRVYLLLDLQCLYGKDRSLVTREALRLLKVIEARSWAAIIIGGYAIPDQISTAVAAREQAYLPRIEQDIFRDMVAYPMNCPRWFADYTVLSPAVVQLDARLFRKVMCPRALYTLNDQWFVIRGAPFSVHPDEYGQYYSIAEDILALDECCDGGYSYGDEYILAKSKKVGKPGNPSSWITACVNHHLTFTANAHK